MIRFFLIFLGIQAVLFGVEMLNTVQAAVVQPWTGLVAQASAAIVHLFDPSVISYGRVLQSAKTGFGVSIEPGCNGVEATIVLVAAMLAFPSSWKMKAWGIGLGFIAVQAVNLLRVVTLFFLGQWNFKVFEFAHLYMWQALIMLDVLVVWLLWMRVVARRDPAAPAPRAAA
ncbi:exosortase H [Ottowia sp.]|uniref:exosortase H n=1 Tax=Ottowia sp. TaxID=1898956 RepID=UPI001DEF2DA3|nr:exosortase H [Ottowia sp.]MCP5257180.1 exosortase H [Burkholderiaceae bacterium]MCB2026231.1 exosortase H [Ottowia sp.]HPK31058.1 exosortase H [Ottowia sp.]HPR45004.1 exosortase H [Ottowia sp.]HRW71590.1 exosortase H [Ottowia sp.]